MQNMYNVVKWLIISNDFLDQSLFTILAVQVISYHVLFDTQKSIFYVFSSYTTPDKSA